MSVNWNRKPLLLLGGALLCAIVFYILSSSSGPIQVATIKEEVYQPIQPQVQEEHVYVDSGARDRPLPPVQHQSDDNSHKSYREQIAAKTDTPHSQTLTFSHIYVVSLPQRLDRRQTMSRIADALNLKFTFVDAVLKDSPLIAWIGERVYEVRQKKRPHLAKALGLAQNRIGGMGINSVWLSQSGSKGSAGTLELPLLVEAQYGKLNWVDYLGKMTQTAAHLDEEPIETRLKPTDPAFNITDKLYDPLEKMPSRQIVPAVLSTWFSHLQAMRQMKLNDDESALVLEDDVDMEWNIESMWNAIHSRLPDDWEVAFLGHCWGREMTYPTGLHPALFHSHSPRCLHGYALSRKGYNHLLELLDDPWIAYQAPVDVTIPTFSLSGEVEPYSVDPPLIMQSKDSPSDIQPGIGSLWRGTLADSTLERIWRDEDKIIPNVTWKQFIKDPAVQRPHVADTWY